MLPKFLRFYRHGGLLCGLADGDAHHCVYDIDQRQWITVSTTTPWDSPLMRHDHDDAFDDAWEALGIQAEELVAEHIDTVAAGVKGIVVETSGKLRFVKKSCTGIEYFNDSSPLYPRLESYQLPQGTFMTILRSDITELDRLSPGVDLVSYAGMEKGVFKYAAYHPNGFGETWMSFQIEARLPKHPNILPVDCLVLDEQTGKRFIGFTTPFIEGGDLGTNKNRLFKLKHLKQLMEVVDFLNYNLGIVHNDMAPRNLLIDPHTDDLILFDFNVSAKIGYKVAPTERGMVAAIVERNDVKGVVMTVHELLTRDPRYEGVSLHYLDETDLLAGPEKWVKHPEVQLESGVDAVHYYNELMRWVEARRERPITVYTQASDPLEWPRRFRDENNPEENEINYDRNKAEKHGWPFIEWSRPREAHLDRSRRLLATGRYADDPSGTSGPGWEGENPVTEARLKDDKAGQEKVSVPVPAATMSNADPDPKPSDATAVPETGSDTNHSLTIDDTTTTTTNPPPHTSPQAEPSNTAQPNPITIPIPTIPTPPLTNPTTEPNPKPETEPNTETKANTKKQATKPLPLAPKAGKSRKRAASAALREGDADGAGEGDGAGRPAVRRSPRVRARSLSRE